MALYNASPFALETQFDSSVPRSPRKSWARARPLDFVTIVLSPMALLGYEVGADSPLMREMVLHLDRQIELTLEALRKVPSFGLAFAARAWRAGPRWKARQRRFGGASD